MGRIIEADRSVIVAADVPFKRLPGLVIETASIEGLGGYKVGIRALSVGLTRTVDTVREHSQHPIIYDHQKAGNDIPDMGTQFVDECKTAGVSAVILFPFTGPETQRDWTQAALDAELGVLVGGHMTHRKFLEQDGGYIANDAPERIYTLAAEMGVRNFVVPGNQPKLVEYYRKVIADVLGNEDFDFFAPGFVTQGGDISETGKVAGKRFHGIMGSAIYGATRKAAEQATAQLHTLVVEPPEPPVEALTPAQERLTDSMYEIGALKFGQFKLKLHEKHPDAPLSPIYFDLRLLRRDPKVMEAAVDAYQELVSDLDFDKVADIPTAATPFTSLLSARIGKGMISPRLDSKSHGSGAKVDGATEEDMGITAVVIDDLITRADSKFQAIEVLEAFGIKVEDVVVLIDRQQGGREELAKRGYRLHAAVTMPQVLESLTARNVISKEQYDEVQAGLAALDDFIAQHPD